MLTDDELELVQQLGECADAFVALVRADIAGGAVESFDIDEFFAHVHDLQHAVMARSTRREHPDVFGRRLPRPYKTIEESDTLVGHDVGRPS